MEEQDVLQSINKLAAEEHELFEKESEGEASKEERQRLQELQAQLHQRRHLPHHTRASRLQDLQVQLDQCWGLLHQRRARRNAGLDPSEAQVRDPGTVEGYVN